MKTGFKLFSRVLVCATMGLILAGAVGVPASAGAATAVGVSALAGNFMPKGAACAGVLTEIWTGELIKTLRAGDVATFLDGIPDYSQYAENDVIHMVDVGGDPDVLINNTTYPIAVQEISDVDAVFSLDKFQTKATPVTDDELYASSYDKMSSLKDRHADAIKVSKYAKAILFRLFYLTLPIGSIRISDVTGVIIPYSAWCHLSTSYCRHISGHDSRHRIFLFRKHDKVVAEVYKAALVQRVGFCLTVIHRSGTGSLESTLCIESDRSLKFICAGSSSKLDLCSVGLIYRVGTIFKDFKTIQIGYFTGRIVIILVFELLVCQ